MFLAFPLDGKTSEKGRVNLMKKQNKHFCLLKVFFSSICLLTFLSLIATGAALAATYYVATNGSDSNPGTEAQPFATIQKGIDVAYAGDTVIVKDGTYAYTGSQDEYWNIFKRNGTAGNYITIKSQNLYGAVLDGNNLAYCSFGMAYDTGLSYIQVEGFEMKNNRWAAIKTNTINGNIPHHITIIRNKIHDMGIVGYTGSYGNGTALITPAASYDFIFDSNIVYNMGRKTYTTWLDQVIYLAGYNHTISNNIFFRNDGYLWTGACISIEAGYSPNTDGHDIKIVNNTFCGQQLARDGHITLCWAYDKQLYNLYIANNIFYDVTYAPIWVWDGAGRSLGDVTVRNNLTTASYLTSTCGGSLWPGTGMIASNNLLNTDPQFVDAANRNYRLRSTSPALSWAYQNDAPGHDIDQLNRPQGTGSDVGAYEYNEGSSPSPDPVPPTDPPTGPAAYYKMDEGVGQVVGDSSGKGNNARLGTNTKKESKDPQWIQGMSLKGLKFDGINDVVTIPHRTPIDKLKKFSVSAWINPDAKSGYLRIISKESSSFFVGGNEFYLCVDPATGYLGVAVVDTKGIEIISNIHNAILAYTWNHVVMTYDDTGDRKCHLYVNGFEVSYDRQDTMIGTLKTTANNWKVGNRSAGDKAFMGIIDNMRIYDRALSASEIADLYDADYQGNPY